MSSPTPAPSMAVFTLHGTATEQVTPEPAGEATRCTALAVAGRARAATAASVRARHRDGTGRPYIVVACPGENFSRSEGGGVPCSKLGKSPALSGGSPATLRP